jgi:hypothetical protein
MDAFFGVFDSGSDCHFGGIGSLSDILSTARGEI